MNHLIAATWMTQRLRADATIAGLIGTRIVDGPIPFDVALPAIRLAELASPDIRGVGAARVMTRHRMLVAAVAETDDFAGLLATLAGRIDALLHAAPAATVNLASVPIGRVLACTRIEAYSLIDTTDPPRVYRHAGGVYELYTQED